MHGQRDKFCFIIYFKKKVITDFYRIFEFIPVLDHFDDELGDEDKRIESRSWGGGIFRT